MTKEAYGVGLHICLTQDSENTLLCLNQFTCTTACALYHCLGCPALILVPHLPAL